MKRLVEFVSNRSRKRFAVNPMHVMYVEEIDDGVSDITLPVSGGQDNDFGAQWIRVDGSFEDVSRKIDDAIDETLRGAKRYQGQ